MTNVASVAALSTLNIELEPRWQGRPQNRLVSDIRVRARIPQACGWYPVFLASLRMLQHNPLLVCILEQEREWLLLFRLTNLDPELYPSKTQHHGAGRDPS
jgi:hypothetical protein